MTLRILTGCANGANGKLLVCQLLVVDLALVLVMPMKERSRREGDDTSNDLYWRRGTLRPASSQQPKTCEGKGESKA